MLREQVLLCECCFGLPIDEVRPAIAGALPKTGGRRARELAGRGRIPWVAKRGPIEDHDRVPEVGLPGLQLAIRKALRRPMTNHPVHWSEGLFISPHHFQLGERRMREEVALAQQWHVGYAYGLRKISLDAEALSN